MKIIIENSTWNNIGDGWYQTSLYMLFKRLFPQHDVFMGEGPVNRSFHPQGRFRKNALNVMEYERADLHVFSGPILPQLYYNYKQTIETIHNRGEAYAMVSVCGYSDMESIGELLRKYPPVLFLTRDRQTYECFKDYVKYAYDGVCTSFFVDKLLDLNPIRLDKPFFISSFYREIEPMYSISKEFDGIESVLIKQRNFWGIKYDYSRHFEFLLNHQSDVGDYRIVRTVQTLSTKFNHINFAKPNSFISFNPIKYLELTKGSEFVISDRVHACAVGLACGKPVRLMHDTPRAGIFERLGWNLKSNDGIMYPNNEIIELEYEKICSEIRKRV